jgi:aspartyl-tRNA(Asn)/glutamyl-tRNA(Gln) amidotransferase subunit C
MKVDNAMIDNLAHLARLQFSDDEKAGLQKDLQSMIAFVEKLNEIDTTGVEPLLHMSSEINVLREDEVKNSITHEEALLNAPVQDDEFFKVPKVIKAPRT